MLPNVFILGVMLPKYLYYGNGLIHEYPVLLVKNSHWVSPHKLSSLQWKIFHNVVREMGLDNVYAELIHKIHYRLC